MGFLLAHVISAVLASDDGVAQLARRREASIFDGDDERMPGVVCGTDLPSVTIAQSGARWLPQEGTIVIVA